ncbi:hypothetical protein ACIQI7_38650 [Kitasatospora sp. NPDC092039]|uniref:hypothetical protein n=1 Tax=Kitasatospora sp. NPDC092039 TaxID=3364086 RepID=UPI00381EE9D2
MQKRTLSKGTRAVFAALFAICAAVGTAGAVGTYANAKAALGSDTAVGVVAGGEGAILVLGLTMLGLTLIQRPYPAAMRLGLVGIPVVAAGAGILIADTTAQRVAYGVSPLAMTAAAELAGLLARSIVVHRTGVDAEGDRRTGDALRLVEYHRARAERHPVERVRRRSERAAWRLARRLGAGDARLGTALPDAYAERTAAAAVSALDALYGRNPVPVEPAADTAASPTPEPVSATPAAPVEIAAPAPEPTPEIAPEPEPEPLPVHEPEPETGPEPEVETPADPADTAPDTAVSPAPGAPLSDVELDVVVHMIRTETDPPRSLRAMEARFRELGYVAGAARLRQAWDRVTAAPADQLPGQTSITDLD